jgi:hypothetical protein
VIHRCGPWRRPGGGAVASPPPITNDRHRPPPAAAPIRTISRAGLGLRAQLTHQAGVFQGDSALIGEHPRRFKALVIKQPQLLAILSFVAGALSNFSFRAAQKRVPL